MNRIKASELDSELGKFLARDVYCNGKLLFQRNSIVDQALCTRLKEVKDDVLFVFVYDTVDENGEMGPLLTSEIIELVKQEVNLTFDRYSFTEKDDIDLMKTLTNFFLEDVFKEKYFLNYLENLYIINYKMFSHILRVTIISLIVSIKANLNQELIRGIAIGSLLHEIGKMKLYIEFPILADKGHTYNIEEHHLMQMYPVLGYREVMNNPLIPLTSKKIILFQHVWEDYDASYDPQREVYTSYPTYYEQNKICKDQKDIAVNIVQVVTCFDLLFTDFHEDDGHLSLEERKKILHYIRTNAGVIFSKTAAELLLNSISLFSINDIVELSNGQKAVVCKHTNNVNEPIIRLDCGTEIDLSQDDSLTIIELLQERSEKLDRQNNHQLPSN